MHKILQAWATLKRVRGTSGYDKNNANARESKAYPQESFEK